VELARGLWYPLLMSSASAVLTAAMKLPRSERADLARELIASLDEGVELAPEVLANRFGLDAANTAWCPMRRLAGQ